MVKSVWQEVAAAELQNSVQDGHDRDLLHCPFAKHWLSSKDNMYWVVDLTRLILREEKPRRAYGKCC